MTRSERTYWSTKYPVRQGTVHPSARKAVRSFPRGRLKILDLGCGYGDDALFFARRGHEVWALDFSAASMRRLRQAIADHALNDIHPMTHDISRRLPFEHDSFDVVYAHLSLHYFDDRVTEHVFADIRRILRPGGLLFVKCKSVDDPLYGKGTCVGPDMFRHGHVRHFFSREYLAEKLRDFSIITLRRSSSMYDGKRSAFVEAVARR
ncbi:MAG: methyltransferase [Candidatus Peregrinibacteria bacterium Greene0416_19]|nr:MAG: methyltransferase [Candidatus Peregrinibacteria bacterium Greene0416_19]